MLPAKFGSIWQSSFRGDFFNSSQSENKNCSWWPCLLAKWNHMKKLYLLANVKQIFSSETALPNGAKLGKKNLCKVLYKVSSFISVWPTNMAAKSNSCF
jgi:hypothetical protein